MKKLLLTLPIMCLIAACTTTPSTTTNTDFDHQTNKTKSTSVTVNKSQKTLQREALYSFGTAVCSTASTEHAKGNIRLDFKLPGATQQEAGHLKVYKDDFVPFDMPNCVKSVRSWAGQATALSVIDAVKYAAKWGVGAYAAVEIFDRVSDRQPSVVADNGSRVNFGDGDFTEAGGLPPESFGELELNSRQDEESEEEMCMTPTGEAPEIFVEEDGSLRCSDGSGGTLPLTCCE